MPLWANNVENIAGNLFSNCICGGMLLCLWKYAFGNYSISIRLSGSVLMGVNNGHVWKCVGVLVLFMFCVAFFELILSCLLNDSMRLVSFIRGVFRVCIQYFFH